MTTFIEGGVTAAKGFQAAGVHCGIRKNRAKKDLGLIVSDRPASAAAVYTRNLVKGAPLTVTQAPTAGPAPSSATAALPTPARSTALRRPRPCAP